MKIILIVLRILILMLISPAVVVVNLALAGYLLAEYGLTGKLSKDSISLLKETNKGLIPKRKQKGNHGEETKER